VESRPPRRPNRTRKDVCGVAECLERRLCLSTTFTTPSSFGGVNSITGIATADFNGDGQPDVVVAGLSPTAGIPVLGVYLNQNGSFATPTLFPFSGTPAGVATGDFVNNGRQDIAAVDSATNTLDVFLGDGRGDFSPGAGASLGGTTGDTQIVSADFNGDHKDDVAVVDPADNSVVVYTSNGDGSFSFAQSISVPSPLNVVVGDFNGDGHPDLAILSGNGSVYVSLNNGSGVFPAPTPYGLALDAPPNGIAATALTGSGRSDLIGIGTLGNAGAFSPLYSASGGTFTPAAPAQLSITPNVVLAGHFTGSGFNDLVMISASGSLQLLPGNGDGTFDAPQTIFNNTLGSGISQAVVANFAGAPGIVFISSANGFGLTTASTGGTTTPTTQTVSPTLTGSLPTSVIAGVPFTAKANLVLTAGSSAASGTASATLLLSPDSTAADSVLTLAATGGKISLKANQTKTLGVKLPKSVPTTVTAGLYHVLIQLTDTAGVAATIDSGKTINVVAPVVDLTGSFVNPPTSVKAGKKFTVTILVTNSSAGNVAAAGTLPFDVATSPDGSLSDAAPLLSDNKRINIKPGKSMKIAFTATLTSAAYLFVNLDPGNAVFPNDINPANNIFSTPSAIGAG
jgi:hypothetical protein